MLAPLSLVSEVAGFDLQLAVLATLHHHHHHRDWLALFYIIQRRLGADFHLYALHY